MLCPPALLYLVFSAFSIFIAFFYKFSIATMLVKVLWVGLWTWLLNYLCTINYTSVAWVLLFLPFVLMLGIFVIALEVLKRKTSQPSSSSHPASSSTTANSSTGATSGSGSMHSMSSMNSMTANKTTVVDGFGLLNPMS